VVKTCPKCQETRPKGEISSNGYCFPCERSRAAQRRASGQSGLQDFVTRSGLSREEARTIWNIVRHPEAACEICGIPAHRLAAYRRKGSPCPSFHGAHHRLEVDRILPGSMGGKYVLSNVRSLCPKCNWLRGPARKSDHEVRVAMWKAWSAFEDMKHLRWFRNLVAVRGVYTLKGPDAEGTPSI
jgi:hypothetical protein